MTREKAIEVLKRSQKIISPISPLYEAIGVALEQLDAGATDTNVGTKLGTDLAEVGTDCISRQAAIVRTSKVIKDDMVAHDVKEVLKHLPSAEPKRGKWIDHRDEGYVECPFCRSATNCDGNIDELHYCFSCGAKMEVTE